MPKHESATEKPERINFGAYTLDLQTYELYCEGKRIPLPARAGRILAMLVCNAGQLVSRASIWDEVWGSQQVDFDANLNTAVRSIRRALDDDAANPRFIETIPRQGYRFIHHTKRHPASSWRQYVGSVRVWAPVMIGLVVALAAAVALRVPKSIAPRTYIDSPGYEAFLQGQFAWSNGQTDEARQRLLAAIEADPGLGPAYVTLGRLAIRNRRAGWDQILDGYALATRALEVDAALPAAHVLKAGIALYYLRDWNIASDHIASAQVAAGDEPSLLVTDAYLKTIQGDSAGALQAIAKAHSLEPLSPSLNANYGWIHYKAGNWNDAERLCKASLKLNATSQLALRCAIHVNHSQGDHAEAAEFALKLMSVRGARSDIVSAIREIEDARMRENACWEWTLDWLTTHESEITDSLTKTGIALTMLGRNDEAVSAFERAFQQRGEPFLAFFAVDPRVDSLRSHPKYPALVALSRTPQSMLLASN